jgi:curved DNA-binding protein CbpA
MPRKSKKPEEATATKTCGWKGCYNDGVYQAPKVREFIDRPRQESDFHWFCMGHIREYNQKWDFFSGMSDDEVVEFQKESITGHRPTNKWELNGNGAAAWQWDESIRKFTKQFMSDDEYQELTKPQLPKNIKEASELLEVTLPESAKELKKKYKLLVKRYHPDVNKGCKASEEKFKAVSAAYHLLVECDFVTS